MVEQMKQVFGMFDHSVSLESSRTLDRIQARASYDDVRACSDEIIETLPSFRELMCRFLPVPTK